MKLALFFILLLLLRLLPWGETQSTAFPNSEDPLRLNETNGSTCARWLYGTQPPQVEAFQCVEQPDGAEVKFCCGTCYLKRNCSFEELAEGSPARPTDGGPEPCPPAPTVSYWVRMLWFCGGVFFTLIFYWAFPRARGRYWRRKTNTRERQGEIELGVDSSVRPREHPGSSGSRGRPAAASSNAPSVQSQAVGCRNGRRVWNPREPVSLRIEPSPSLPNRGGRRPRARSTC